jgi:hypothetical protein
MTGNPSPKLLEPHTMHQGNRTHHFITSAFDRARVPAFYYAWRFI